MDAHLAPTNGWNDGMEPSQMRAPTSAAGSTSHLENGMASGGGIWGLDRSSLLFSMRDVALLCQMLLSGGASQSPATESCTRQQPTCCDVECRPRKRQEAGPKLGVILTRSAWTLSVSCPARAHTPDAMPFMPLMEFPAMAESTNMVMQLAETKTSWTWFCDVVFYIAIFNVVCIFLSGVYGFIKKKYSAPLVVATGAALIEIVILTVLSMNKYLWFLMAFYSMLLFIMYTKKFRQCADPESIGGELLDALVEAKDWVIDRSDEVIARETLRKIFGFLAFLNLFILVMSIIAYFTEG